DAGIGEQAWAFFKHAIGQEQRGVSWSRIVHYQNRIWTEEDLLRHLWLDMNLSVAEIASVLNDLFQTADPAHPEIRTEASIQAKLSALGLTRSFRRDHVIVEHPDYGFLKE